MLEVWALHDRMAQWAGWERMDEARCAALLARPARRQHRRPRRRGPRDLSRPRPTMMQSDTLRYFTP